MKPIAALALLALCAASCASTRFIVNQPELAKVKSAAIIGFGVDLSGLATGFGRFPPAHWQELRREQAALSYRAVVERLAGIGWDMLGELDVSTNEEYEDEYEHWTAHNFMASAARSTGPLLFIPGIIWDSDVWDLEVEDRSR